MIDQNTVKALVVERMKEIGDDLFLVDIDISSGNKISVAVDRMKGSISINDCVSISRNVEHNLDREQEDFELNVSSAGIGQPFQVPKQYQKNLGREVKVKFDHGKVEGVLSQVDKDYIVITEQRKERIEGRKKKQWVQEDKKIPMDTISETYVKLKF